jgi:hypothetical protein
VAAGAVVGCAAWPPHAASMNAAATDIINTFFAFIFSANLLWSEKQNA